MAVIDWKDCPLVTARPDVKHGEPVFAKTRVEVEPTIDSYCGYRQEGLSDNAAVKALLKSHPTIPGADALRKVLAYEAPRQPQHQP